jgi:hypothetical protein
MLPLASVMFCLAQAAWPLPDIGNAQLRYPARK